MDLVDLLPAYTAGMSATDVTAFTALAWAVQDHRPDMDEASILKSLLRWNGPDWKANAARLLATAAPDAPRFPLRTVAEPPKQLARTGSALSKMLVVLAVVATLNMILFAWIQTRKAQSTIDNDSENAAVISLHHASTLSGDNRIQWLKAVVADHPGTRAAVEAQAELDSLAVNRN